MRVKQEIYFILEHEAIPEQEFKSMRKFPEAM